MCSVFFMPLIMPYRYGTNGNAALREIRRRVWLEAVLHDAAQAAQEGEELRLLVGAQVESAQL